MNDLLRAFALSACLSLLAACNGKPPEAATSAPAAPRTDTADLVFRNGAVYTVVPGREWATAVAVSDGVIRYVGDDAGATPWIGPDTQVVDLGGRMLAPGFQDAHVHPLTAGVDFQQCPLYGLETPEKYAAAVAECARKDPQAAWVIGAGWLLTAFPGGIPDKALLDSAVPDRPVALTSTDGHTLWVNSKALAAAGITRDTPDPVNGRIDRDPKSGEPSGSLQESAMGLVMKLAPPLSDELLERSLRYSLQLMNGLGITAWQDAAVTVGDDPFRSLQTYRRLDDAGGLTARIVLSLLWDSERGVEQIDDLVRARDQFAGGNIRTATVKIFLDGVIEAQTSALIDDYSDRPGFKGENQVPVAVLNEGVARMDAAGFQVHIHAIGDAAIRGALDAFEHARAVNGPTDNRHHIAHIELIHPDDQPRFARLGVTANFQPLWAFADPYIVDLTLPRVGPARTPWIYPIGSVVRTGARVAFGSDWSVSSVNPLEGIEVAVTRMGPQGETTEPFLPDERISLGEAIAAYTIGAAYVNHLDDRTGTIETGKSADLIVLDNNLFKIEPARISDTKVLLTLLAGKPVAGGFDKLAAP
jgi:predicted amidohydrolase YtcJ